MIFVCYREEDTHAVVAGLETQLRNQFGDQNVFRDQSGVQPGAAWPEVLQRQLLKCRVVLVIVGERWGTVTLPAGPDKGLPRLRDPDDWVRNEIAAALSSQKVVIPVLINGAQLPDREWLRQAEIEGLAERQSISLRTTRNDYQGDCARLLRIVATHLAAAIETGEPADAPLSQRPAANVGDQLRAYLQRCEVRLSTMHRIAGAFVGGAGLTVLFPIILRPEFFQTITSIAGTWPGEAAHIFLLGWAMVLLPLLSPVIAFGWLFRDLVAFYFTTNSPGYVDKYPRFILGPVPIPDEPHGAVAASLRAARAAAQIDARIQQWLVSADTDSEYFASVVANSLSAEYLKQLRDADEGHPRPINMFDATRPILGTDADESALDELHERIAAIVRRLAATSRRDKGEEKWIARCRLEVATVLSAQRPTRIMVEAARSISGYRTAALAEEVVYAELLLTLHSNKLRRLVLRYVKALIAFLAVLIGFVAVNIVSYAGTSANWAVALVFVLLGPGSMFVVRSPIRWIFDADYSVSGPRDLRDPALTRFELSHLLTTLLGSVAACAWWMARKWEDRTAVELWVPLGGLVLSWLLVFNDLLVVKYLRKVTTAVYERFDFIHRRFK